MFSRTTIASSISSPMHSDSAIRVRKLRVNPNAWSAMKVAMTAIGSVRPVMTVLRQLCRNRNTMITVRMPPSTMVCFTRSTLASATSAVEKATRSSTSGGRRLRRTFTASVTPAPVSTMFASCAFCRSTVIARRPLMRASDVSSFSPSTTSATCDRNTGDPPCCATTIRANWAGSLIRPSTRTSASVAPREMRPAGTSWLAARTAFMTWSMPMPSAVRACGFTWIRICRVTRPFTSIRATPGTFSRPLTMVWSVSDVRSRGFIVGDITASDTTGCVFSLSARITRGSFTSRGNVGRTWATLSRTSCIARAMSVDSRNSAKTWLCPSSELERMSFTPATALIAYSSGFVTSVSTDSGDAPGYVVITSTNGRLTSGICSTRRRW